MIEKCPIYAPEEEFLEEHNKQQVWKTLSEKTNR
jgi:hypothetical protein